jgi:hypothetical protein
MDVKTWNGIEVCGNVTPALSAQNGPGGVK